MKPLSVINYNRNNKIKFLTSIISVAVAVGFLYILITFVTSVQNSMYRTVLNFKDYSICLPYSKEKGIPARIVSKVQNNDNVDKIIPIGEYAIQYTIPYEETSTKLLAIRNEDTNYLLSKVNDNIIQGRLPRDGENEVAVHYYEAKNQGLKLGGVVGEKEDQLCDIRGKYKVVGIIGGENIISIISANETSMPDYKDKEKAKLNGFIILPKSGGISKINKSLSGISKKQVETYMLNNLKSRFNELEGDLGSLNVIIIASIFLMVVTVGSSRYIQFFNRKEEFGILNAIGYSKKKILKRTLIEVFEANVLAYLLGVAIGIALSFLSRSYIFEPEGAVGVVFDLKAFIIALYIPMFTAVFTIVPINVMISKLDPINMIEEN